MWKAAITLIALGIITVSVFAGHALHGWATDAKYSWLRYQEQKQELALERDRIALEEQQLALERKRAENQAAVAAAQTEYLFRQTVFSTFLFLMLVVVPILTMVLVWRYFQKRQAFIAPNRDGVFPMPTMYPSDVAALSAQTALAFHQTRALAAQNTGAPVHYAPHTHHTYQHTSHGPVMPAPDQPPILTDTPTVDLAALKVDLLAHLRPGVNADSILLGVDAVGEEIRSDIHTMMHTLSGGTTGGGKTTLLAGLGLQLAFDPNVALVVADPHLQELALLEDTGALMYPLPQNVEQAAALLSELAREVRQRAELFALASERLKELEGRRIVLNRVDKFNAVCDRLGLTPIPSVVAFGDELRGMLGDSKEGAQALDVITSEGRKFGVYFVGGSQSWKANVVDTATRQMFWTRYLLPGMSLQQAAAILEMDQKSARPIVNHLTAPGVCALWRRGQPTVVVKAPYIDLESDQVWDAIEAAAACRGSHRVPLLRSATSEAVAALRGTTTGATGATAASDAVPESAESGTARQPVAVSEEERERILRARDDLIAEGQPVSKRAVCRRAFNGVDGGQAFKKVRVILDGQEVAA